MENMCLASEVNNVLVSFPGTGEASGNLRQLLTTKAEWSRRQVGVRRDAWAHCERFTTLGVGIQSGAGLGPRKLAAVELGTPWDCGYTVGLSHRPRLLGTSKCGRHSHSSK